MPLRNFIGEFCFVEGYHGNYIGAVWYSVPCAHDLWLVQHTSRCKKFFCFFLPFQWSVVGFIVERDWVCILFCLYVRRVCGAPMRRNASTAARTWPSSPTVSVATGRPWIAAAPRCQSVRIPSRAINAWYVVPPPPFIFSVRNFFSFGGNF